jgi:hypothetical protein
MAANVFYGRALYRKAFRVYNRYPLEFSFRRSQNMNNIFKTSKLSGELGRSLQRVRTSSWLFALLLPGYRYLRYFQFLFYFILRQAPIRPAGAKMHTSEAPHTRLRVSVIHDLSRPVSTTSPPEIKYTSIPLRLDVRCKSRINPYRSFVTRRSYSLTSIVCSLALAGCAQPIYTLGVH